MSTTFLPKKCDAAATLVSRLNGDRRQPRRHRCISPLPLDVPPPAHHARRRDPAAVVASGADRLQRGGGGHLDRGLLVDARPVADLSLAVAPPAIHIAIRREAARMLEP